MTLSYASKAQVLLDRNLQKNSQYWVAFFLCTGFAIRCALASVAPLNADEAYFYHIGNQPTAFDTWKQSQTTAHPPLFFLVVRYWEMLGSSELSLRILSAALGVLAAFMMYRWICSLLNQAPAGLFALVFASCAPFPLGLSIELRQYTLLLLLAFSALYSFERERYYLTALFCTAAVSTHYSAVFLLPYFPVLLLVRYSLLRRFDWRSACRACLPLLLPIAVFAALYFTHIRTFPAARTRDVQENWLAAGYFHHGAESVGAYLATRVYRVLESQYSYLSWPRLALVGVVLAFGFWRRLTRDFAIQLLCYGGAALVMLLLAGSAAVFGYYPISPTRHSSILLVFTVPVVCLLFSHVCRGRSSWGLVLSIIVVSAFLWYSRSFDPWFDKTGRRADMVSMATLLRSVAADGKVVFSDYGSAVLLNYYLEPQRSTVDMVTGPAGRFYDYWWNGVHVVCSSSFEWRSPESFFQEIAALAKQRDLAQGVYVVNAGFSKPLAPGVGLQGQPPGHWLLGNPGKPEVFWLPLGGAQHLPPLPRSPSLN
jgi:hypothetical protein